MRIPELPGRYGQIEPIGVGAMGTVYRAFDSELERTVAIKVLLDRYAADPDLRERFRREAEIAARLTGAPSTVGVLDVGMAGRRPYIVLEYVAGGSLADRLAHGLPARSDALRWIEQAGRALDAAHEQGIVHRDVKPANLLLDGAGDVHISDFGIARAIGDTAITSIGTVLGTAGYLSPEQARGEAATEASDRYALAVVAFELLYGRRPDERAPRAQAGPEVARVFDRALAEDPSRRYPSCAAFAAALRAALGDEAATIPLGATAVLPAALPKRRRRAVVAAVAVGLAAAGIATALGLGAGGGGGEGAVPPPRITVREVVTRTVHMPAPVPSSRQVIAVRGLTSGRAGHAERHGKHHGHGHGRARHEGEGGRD